MDIIRGTGGIDIIDHERTLTVFATCVHMCVCGRVRACACVDRVESIHNDGVHLRIDDRCTIVLSRLRYCYWSYIST